MGQSVTSRAVRSHGLGGWAGVGLGLALLAACATGGEPEAGIQGPNPVGPTADNPLPNDEDDDDDDDDGFDDGNDDAAQEAGDDEGPVTFLGCCQRHEEPGCQDPDVAECVCAMSPACCDDTWSQDCVVDGVAAGCMECSDPQGDAGDNGDDAEEEEGGDEGVGTDSADDGPADAGDGTNDCCAASEAPGCDNAMVQSCVCAADPFCCEMAWDEVCIELVDTESCGDCGGPSMPSDTGGDGSGPPVGTCCTAQDAPGCVADAIQACVCAIDDFCCDFAWDEFCVEIVTDSDCGEC